MKPVLLLIAIYSLIIHQVNKDHAVKRYLNRAGNAVQIRAKVPKMDLQLNADHIFYKTGFTASPSLLLKIEASSNNSAKNPIIWPEEIEMNARYSPTN